MFFQQHARWLIPALVVLSVAGAQDAARGADWRVFGSVEKDGKQYVTLYSVSDLVRSPDGTVRVWTEASSITSADMDRAIKKGKDLIAIVAGRIRAHYTPPVSAVEKIDDDQIMHMIVLEEMANERKVAPTLVVLCEIDCKGQRSRDLQIAMYKKGQPTSLTEQPGNWSYILPQSNGKRLATLVCDPRLTAPDNTPTPSR